ncbi:hypothetical protein SNOG_15496 [Parastagonospora nodorum SN15]|uniref:Uncharacterized protein n=1 Tax=Phaeosphaeria nodorum (strain SN15 / ATCC MYA-4574 / FGSC 10173) TaxID=321614 RepID=Q0TYG1_PHANO|nr:hypothetical protein SNOG_15496 [Parastagonospora nodorum SN15]EAT77161.2 hypothetical protein SNOG_15496 [Parastagonospora nodorum SN15]
MGGNTFPNLAVPRMSPEIYNRVLVEYQSKLDTIFDRVVVPRDAPAKADYGDVDFLVQGHSKTDIWNELKTLLGSELEQHNGGSTSFAIPHPEIAGAHVQIDVELSPGDGTPDAAALFEWTRFIKGDSDMMQIIGISHRALGLTCTDTGFYVRVEQIEPYDKEKAKLFLTRDPNEAMKFYGLDTVKYWAGFRDETELFDWSSSVELKKATIDRGKQRDRCTDASLRMYMPAHAEKNASTIWTRQEVLEEAIKYFSKQTKYNQKIAEHMSRQNELTLWGQIRTVLPIASKSSQDFALKSLRRWVFFQNGQPRIATEANLDDPAIWTNLMAPGSLASLLTWVTDHWEEAKVLEKARANAAKSAALAG